MLNICKKINLYESCVIKIVNFVAFGMVYVTQAGIP